MFLFEKLDIYQKSLDLSEEITAITEDFPGKMYYLSSQLNSAVLSIADNLAEGNGRGHEKDKNRFFYYARGSAQECIPMLELCKRKNLISEEKHKEFRERLQAVCKMTWRLIHRK